MQKPTQKEIKALNASGQFDADWYQRTYPDVITLGMEPAEHYLTYGYRMDRNPGPTFHTTFVRTVFGIKPHHEPVARFAWLARKADGTPTPNPQRVLLEASKIARAGDHERAIALAEAHLPADLAYSANVLHANLAICRGDDVAWQTHLNTYLSHFKVAPIQLKGTGSLFERLACEPLPAVTGGPLISVLMPAWNAEKTVTKAVRSILDQTWQNLELLIVDDASTDGTWSILQKIAASDDRVKILRNTFNVGPYISKNIALTMANGDWITGHDADDWAMPGRLERHMQEAQAQDAEASLSYMVRIQPNGIFGHIAKVGSFSPDGAARKASISTLFKAALLRDRLGFWDDVRFSADSEMIARTEALLQMPIPAFSFISMLCLDLETSLTNNTQHGVDKNSGISNVRADYRNQWVEWHKTQLTSENAFLPFPQGARRYQADQSMIVEKNMITANIAAAKIAMAGNHST